MSQIRIVNKGDLSALIEIIESTELFPPELLVEMTLNYFNNSACNEIWVINEVEDKPVALAYCALEPMTSATYNLHLIAVHKDFQGIGKGSEMVFYIEEILKKKLGRVLIVETSALPEFERTRKFYSKLMFSKEATIREFYKEGEDKIIYWKKLL